jgi:hypothetical protein
MAAVPGWGRLREDPRSHIGAIDVVGGEPIRGDMRHRRRILRAQPSSSLKDRMQARTAELNDALQTARGLEHQLEVQTQKSITLRNELSHAFGLRSWRAAPPGGESETS